jgi:hypothetical protein
MRAQAALSPGPDAKKLGTHPLEGEDIATEHWENAHHSMSIYDVWSVR